ncbi:hypothetical protein [Desertibacillus haloalkaliphilus]|nr:hypothetical protein [Desertibacillus haloalkaliphilus]MBU8908533.1 hypothetical protein [Desertibacillus haloalkaliphilus]
MGRKRKRQPKWHLLFRREGYENVYRYEPLQNHELKSRKRKGWKII